MHHADLPGEPVQESPGRLRRQRDLRHQHDRRIPILHHLIDSPEVDLGLTRAGDPMQEEGSTAGTKPLPNRAPGRLLLGGQLGRRAGGRRRSRQDLG
jgi:hypothetical protein